MLETPLAGRRHDGLVTVFEAPPGGMIALRGDLGEARLRDGLAEVTGAAPPERGRIAAAGKVALLWMAPDELLALVPPERTAEIVALLGDALGGVPHLVADVSDMRTHLRIEGVASRDVLAKLTPADLSPATLPEGHVRRSRVGAMAAAFWFGGGGADLVCFRSVAGYVFDLLADAARPGTGLGLHRA